MQIVPTHLIVTLIPPRSISQKELVRPPGDHCIKIRYSDEIFKILQNSIFIQTTSLRKKIIELLEAGDTRGKKY